MKLVILTLACLTGMVAAATEPATAALEFLEKVRLGTVNLEPGKDTAISPHTSAEKRKEISKRLERMAGDLGKSPLEAGDVKVDGDLAAVLVRNSGSYDPARMRVFSIGLVKSKNQWLPAPVPASFENTGLSFVSALRGRADALESWMLGNQVTDLEKIRDQSTEKMKREIRNALDPDLLRTSSPEKLSEQFLAACSRRDLPAILGFLGGLQEQLPDNWSERLRAADAAVAAGKRVGWPWRLAMAPEVVRVRVHDAGETNGFLISYACLDPAGKAMKSSRPKVEILHLEFSQSDEGLWKVDPPSTFFLAPDEEPDESDDDFDKDLLDAFPAAVRKQYPAKPASDMASAAAALNEALRSKQAVNVLSLMDLSGDEAAASRGCALATQAWWQLHNPNAPRHPVLLGHHEEGNTGLVAFQFFSPREAERLEMRSFYFEKTPSGWLIMPGVYPTNSPTESQVAVRKWMDNEMRTVWQKNWQASLLKDSQRIDKIKSGNAPSDEQARELVGSWLSAMRDGNIETGLRLTAFTDRPGNASRLLQNLGYELGAASKEDSNANILSIERGETWTIVSVRLHSRGSEIFPLYLAVSTPAGPRLLIETDLFTHASSGRDLLNKSKLGKLRESTEPESYEELLKLIAKFPQLTGK